MAKTTAQVITSLKAARDNFLTALENLASDAATGDIKPAYSVGGQSVSWPEAYRVATEMAKSLTDEINRLTWAGGPVDHYMRS